MMVHWIGRMMVHTAVSQISVSASIRCTPQRKQPAHPKATSVPGPKGLALGPGRTGPSTSAPGLAPACAPAGPRPVYRQTTATAAATSAPGLPTRPPAVPPLQLTDPHLRQDSAGAAQPRPRASRSSDSQALPTSAPGPATSAQDLRPDGLVEPQQRSARTAPIVPTSFDLDRGGLVPVSECVREHQKECTRLSVCRTVYFRAKSHFGRPCNSVCVFGLVVVNQIWRIIRMVRTQSNKR